MNVFMYFSTERQNCYMVLAEDLLNEGTSEAGGKGASQGMFIGCLVGTATGVLSFTCDGKLTQHRYQMEPGTKLFPAIFVEATSKDMMQIELGRTETTLPFSSAILHTCEKQATPMVSYATC